jgi:hypothetical protein
MKEENSIWLIWRIAMIVACMLVVPYVMRDQRNDFPEPALAFPIGIAAACCASVLLFSWIRVMSKTKLQEWRIPSWRSNPFVINEPLQNFSDAAYSLIGAGFASMAAELIHQPRTWSWELLLSIGFGFWLGVRLSVIAFRNSFAAS